MRHTNRSKFERYPLERSPLAQNPSQRDVAELVKETKTDLKTLAQPSFKDQFIVRRTINANGKARQLVYPEGRLRAVHERLRISFSRIVQPSYLMSPRKGKSQRENALVHLNSAEFMTLDLRQFYPSTTRQMIRDSLVAQFGMQRDVAGLIAHLATADDRACFGSPLTPVLASIVHRPMFDSIADRCLTEDLCYSVWVDDLTISGRKITGCLRSDVRDIVARSGLRSHKLKLFSGNRPVFVTGVGIVGSNLIVPAHVELRAEELWAEFHDCETFDEKDTASTRLLSHLGGIRAVVGKDSPRGKRIAGSMNSIRQKRDKLRRAYQAEFFASVSGGVPLTEHEANERVAEIEMVPF